MAGGRFTRPEGHTNAELKIAKKGVRGGNMVSPASEPEASV